MAEGPLVSVQHRLSVARTLATRARDSCSAAHHLPATLPPEHRPCVSVEAGLISAPLGKGYSATSPPRLTPLSALPLLHLRRAHHVGELLHPLLPSRFTVAASSSHHPHPSSCAGTPGEAQNRHPAAALSAPTAVIGESLAPRTLVQSPPLAAMPHPSGHFPSILEAREASYPVNPPRRR
jgi:hypothetical protein